MTDAQKADYQRKLNAGFIAAKKGNTQTLFSPLSWKNLGKDKNGWAPVNTKDRQPTTVKDDQEYSALTEQAKGFETDGKLTEALGKFRAASSIKPSPWLTGQMNRVMKAIEELDQQNSGLPLVSQEIQEALDTEDYVLAIELLEELKIYQPDSFDAIEDKIKEVNKKLEDE